METNEIAYSVAIGLLGLRTVAPQPHGGFHTIHELWCSAVRVHTGYPLILYSYTVLLALAKCASTRILHRLPNYA